MLHAEAAGVVVDALLHPLPRRNPDGLVTALRLLRGPDLVPVVPVRVSEDLTQVGAGAITSQSGEGLTYVGWG